MRIPPSVFVMSVLTIVPFGLGIRDSMNAKATHHHRYDEDDAFGDDSDSGDSIDRRHAREELAKEEAEQAEQQAALTKVHDEEAQRVRERFGRTLFGETPASLGPAFLDTKIGAPMSDTVVALLDGINGSSEVLVSAISPGATLDGIVVSSIETNDSCKELTPPASWGEPTALDFHTSVWTAKATENRVVLDATRCRLTFDKMATVTELLDRKDTAVVPLSIVGTSAKKLIDRLGPIADGDETSDTIRWDGRGLADGSGPTHLAVDVKAGKITSLTANGTASPSAIFDLQARMTKLYGAPKTENDVLVWSGKLAPTLSANGTGWTLSLGGDPSDQ